MSLQPMISSADLRSRDHGMSSAAQGRLAMIEVLRIADEEARWLGEMIRLLRRTPGMDATKLGELIVEWRVARERAIALETELRAFDALAWANFVEH